jgi:predicted DNA-binding transcriptional regulator AlpA
MTSDIVGTVEIAERLAVPRSTVEGWRARGRSGVTFPPPARKVGGRPAWEWDDVRAWTERTRKP